MTRVVEQPRVKRFGLPEARQLAGEIGHDKAALRALVRKLFGDDVAVRKRAADTARPVKDRDPGVLEKFADELAGLRELLPVEEVRTRWHLGLVVPRVAQTPTQRMRAARVMPLLAEDESNVVRCPAIEGLGTLALRDATLRDEADALVERFLWDGTPAMKCHARHTRKMLAKKYGEQ